VIVLRAVLWHSVGACGHSRNLVNEFCISIKISTRPIRKSQPFVSRLIFSWHFQCNLTACFILISPAPKSKLSCLLEMLNQANIKSASVPALPNPLHHGSQTQIAPRAK